MKWIKNNLFAMITLNSPHMGCLGDKFLVNTGNYILTLFNLSGIKLMNIFTSKLSLRQMSISDKSKKIEHMSEYKTIKWFKNILLLSYIDDGYAPHDSAKIYLSDLNLSKRHNKMVFNFWNNIEVSGIIMLIWRLTMSSKCLVICQVSIRGWVNSPEEKPMLTYWKTSLFWKYFLEVLRKLFQNLKIINNYTLWWKLIFN